jgi:hypothetical protein
MSPERKDSDMLTLKKPTKQYYSETEAAHSLCISLEALHEILDKQIFNAEHPRPAVLEFTHAELLLLSIWAEPERGRNVLAMPARN